MHNTIKAIKEIFEQMNSYGKFSNSKSQTVEGFVNQNRSLLQIITQIAKAARLASQNYQKDINNWLPVPRTLQDSPHGSQIFSPGKGQAVTKCKMEALKVAIFDCRSRPPRLYFLKQTFQTLDTCGKSLTCKSCLWQKPNQMKKLNLLASSLAKLL